MTKTEILKNLRIEYNKENNLYFICVGIGTEFRCFSASHTEKAAKHNRAYIRKNPAEYGIM